MIWGGLAAVALLALAAPTLVLRLGQPAVDAPKDSAVVQTMAAIQRAFPQAPASAQVAVLVGQIVIPSLGGPLLGVALGRWVHFPGAALVLSLVIFGWVNVATFGSLSHPDSAAFTALRLFSPFAFFTYMENVADVTTWRGSPWFFIGWQLALCAIAVLVALLRGAEGRVRFRVARTLQIVLVMAAILLVLAAVGGFPHAVTT